MPHLTRSDLWSLEQYSEQRNNFRAEVLAHKKNRQLSLGDMMILPASKIRRSLLNQPVSSYVDLG